MSLLNDVRQLGQNAKHNPDGIVGAAEVRSICLRMEGVLNLLADIQGITVVDDGDGVRTLTITTWVDYGQTPFLTLAEINDG